MSLWSKEIYLPGLIPVPKYDRRRIQVYKEIGLALSSGLPLEKALDKVSSNDLFIRANLKRLKKNLEKGESFAKAAKKASYLFPRRYRRFIEQGEKTDKRVEMFRLMERQYYRDAELRVSTQAAMIYPAIVLSIATVCYGVLLIFVVPTFYQFTQNFGGRFPPAVSLATPCFALLLFAMAVILLGPVSIGRRWAQWIFERIPIAGRVFRYHFWTGFVRAMGKLMEEGVPAGVALETAEDVMSWRSSRSLCAGPAERSRRGDRLSDAMSDVRWFPRSLVWTVRQGEITGNLPEDLLRLADRYEKTSEFYRERLIKVFEILATVLLATGIGSYVIWYYTVILGFAAPLL